MVNNLVFRWPTTLFFMVLGGSWYIVIAYRSVVKLNVFYMFTCEELGVPVIQNLILFE